MIYSNRLKEAIAFSIKTHEIYQKQKRHGKDIPYIIHPLTVGIILAHAGLDENLVIAGVLHDSIEDSIDEKKVTKEMLEERFGKQVADLVDSVTEKNKQDSFEERKREALSHIEHFTHEMTLLKCADTIANVSDIIDDHKKHGDVTFNRFVVPKAKFLKHYISVIEALQKKSEGNVFFDDLNYLHKHLLRINSTS